MALALEQVRRFRDVTARLKDAAPDAEVVTLLEEAEEALKSLSVEVAFDRASDKQRQQADEFWSSKYDIQAAVGGNRSGKSICMGWMCCARYLRDRAKDGELVWCISQNSNKSKGGCQKELWNALPHERFSSTWGPEHGFGMTSVVRFQTHDDGWATIEFKNEEQALDTFETSKVNLVWWDEASVEALLGRLLPRVTDTDGKILISTIPEQIWLKFRIELSGNPRWQFVKYVTYDNQKNLAAGAIDKLAAGLTAEERRMRIEGEFVSLSGVIVREFINAPHPEGHIVKAFKVPDGWPVWVYLDVGFYTGAPLMTVGPDEIKRVVDCVYTEGKRADQNTEDVKFMLERHGRTIKDLASPIRIDPAAFAYTPSNTKTLGQEYIEAGLPVAPWDRVQDMGWRAMVNRMRVAFQEKKVLITDNCMELIRELQTWRWKMDDQQKVDLREKADTGPDHLIDGLRSWLATDPTFARPTLTIMDHPEMY